MIIEDRREVYVQDWENVRYQDGLRWSRFQTVSAIEGAYLAAVYTTSLDSIRGLVLAIVASAIILMVCLLALKDERDARVHLCRAKALEAKNQMDILPIEQTSSVLGLRGKEMMFTVILLLNILNIVVIIDHIFKVQCM